ncbi:hypothetical protein KY317_04190 [Candidatus Woesearchaeota archaeon]|nr:hypothetical protein [Candidatus Woesearchaeota archaeon]
MKTFKESLGELKNSELFKNWKKKNPESFLSYGFAAIPKLEFWKIGFYHPDKDILTSFIVENEIEIEGEEKAFKKEQTKIKKLNTAKIKTNHKEILKTAEKLQKEKYRNENPKQIIMIIQNLAEQGTIWNITYVTETISTLNIKISAETGKILSHNLVRLFEFKK